MLTMLMAMPDEPEDKALFERAYNRYKGNMLALAYKIIGNYHDAEEAVSCAFFKIADNFDKLKQRSPRERAAFYSVVTKNCAYDILRKKERRNEIPLGDDEEIPDVSADVSDEVLSGYEYERVVETIRQLPGIYAQALYLQNVTGLSIRELASVLGESEDVIRKRLERARKKLRKLLDEQEY